MESIHECRIVAHVRRKRRQQMADALRLIEVHVEIADQDDAAFGPDGILAPRELARGHVAFHNVHPVLRIEGHAGDLIEANHVVLADETALPAGHVDEHAGYCRLAA
jgi:hypothetical protein